MTHDRADDSGGVDLGPRAAFDLAGPLPSGRIAIEASAGTGKTYTITGLIVRYLANGDVGVDELLVVTFTRAAVNELRDRTRSMLRRAVAVVNGEPVPAADPWMSTLAEGGDAVVTRRRRRLQHALARFDEATITTIHGFCQLALTHGGVRAGVDPGAQLVEDGTDLVAEVCRDVLVRRLADSPYRLSTTDKGANASSLADKPRQPRKIETELRTAVATVLAHPLARLDPIGPAVEPAGDWRDAVVEAAAEVRARRRARRQIGYDDLVTELMSALDAAGGDQLAAQLARRFPLVLVDEFQDTDPAQWHIFSAAFGRGRLITVGDPKQAIYRFRGADLHAYLDAVRHAAPSGLLTNYRSDRHLLDALGVLMDGARLGHPAVRFVAVGARADAPDRSLAAAPMQFHLVPDDDSLVSERGRLSTGAASAVVLGDLASRVRELLDSGTAPEHIAVLVTSQVQATAVATMLRRWGIPTARARTGSVLHTDAATHWRVLVAALASPSRTRLVRAAGLGWFFDLDPTNLADEDGARLAQLQQRLAAWADLTRTDGVGAVYERLRADTDVLDVVLAGRDGDRHLADLDQIAELLVTATAGRGTDPHKVRNILDDLVADADDQRETTMRRVETDTSAVQVTTIHAAKGLEYPVVMVPFAYSMKASASRPYTYAVVDSATGRHERVVDVASWVAWSDEVSEGAGETTDAPSNQAQRKTRATDEVFGDQQRLLYVALTRAQHQLHVWWADVTSAEKSPLGRLVLDRDADGPLLNSATSPAKASVAAVRAQLGRLSAACGGAISVDDARLAPNVRPAAASAPVEAPELRTAPLGGRAPLRDPTWRSWSFSAIASGIAGPAVGRDAVGTLGGDDAPAGGGSDEPIEPADVELPDDTPAPSTVTAVPPPRDGQEPAMPLADVVAGTTFGTMVHTLLEIVDFTAPDLAASLRTLAVARARGAGLLVDPDILAAGLVAAVNTPLGPLFAGRSLGDFPPAERLSELGFDLPVVSGDGRRLEASAIAEALLDTLPTADALRPYASALRSELVNTRMAGWLTGSIDGVFRVPGNDRIDHGDVTDHRYVIVDYKTNRLHEPGSTDPLAAYRPDRLVPRMAEHHYPLQAVLYSVALHRYLRWRLGGRYRPDHHLGGIAYLFVRGMVGAATPVVDGVPHGVFSYRLPSSAIVAVDELFERGSRL